MSWKKEIDELKKREKLAEAMGGPEKLKKQKEFILKTPSTLFFM